ncbi:spore germination protein [Paenibacillus sp. CC-CFT747]|nr:spore germination protein [Paenibacillus sp. CC-CFT747]
MQITPRQATLWFILYQVGSAILVLPSTLATVAKQDAWLAVVAALGLHLLWFPLYRSIAVQMKSQTFGTYMNALFGTAIGKSLLFVFILGFPYLIFVLTLRNLGDFLTTSIITKTPVEIVYAVMLVAVLYALRMKLKVIGRASEILFPLVLLLFVILTVSLLPSVKLQNELPLLENGLKTVFRASIPLVAFPYLESILFLFFVPYLDRAERWNSAVFKSCMISGILFLICTMVVVGVLSAEVTENLPFPSYYAVRTVSIGNFYERFEVLVAIIWFVTIFFRLSLLLFVSANGLAEVFSLKDTKPLLLPLAFAGIYMANAAWPNLTFLLEFFNIWPSYAMIFGSVFPLLFWVTGRVRKF